MDCVMGSLKFLKYFMNPVNVHVPIMSEFLYSFILFLYLYSEQVFICENDLIVVECFPCICDFR